MHLRYGIEKGSKLRMWGHGDDDYGGGGQSAPWMNAMKVKA